jgi:hypothetical protein
MCARGFGTDALLQARGDLLDRVGLGLGRTFTGSDLLLDVLAVAELLELLGREHDGRRSAVLRDDQGTTRYLPAALASALRYARTACIAVGASRKETSAFRSMPGNCSLRSPS